MTKVGNVSLLFYTPSIGHTSVDSLSLDSRGILQDKHYNKDAQRSVLIASLESYALAREHGIDTVYGMLGENILIDYNPYSLQPGSRLMIANTTLEICQPCTLCKGLSSIDSRLPLLLKKDRGIFAKVVKSGSIAVADTIYLLE